MTSNRTRIRNTEYASSRQRLDALQQIVIDGNEAESVIKYADRLVEEIGKITLESMLVNDANLVECQMFYKVAVRFAQLVKSAASQGKQKEAVLESLRE